MAGLQLQGRGRVVVRCSNDAASVQRHLCVRVRDTKVFGGDPAGRYSDDVAFTNTQEADPPAVNTVPPNTTSFQFNPASHNATYNLQVQAQFFGSGRGDWGPVKQVTSPK